MASPTTKPDVENALPARALEPASDSCKIYNDWSQIIIAVGAAIVTAAGGYAVYKHAYPSAALCGVALIIFGVCYWRIHVLKPTKEIVDGIDQSTRVIELQEVADQKHQQEVQKLLDQIEEQKKLIESNAKERVASTKERDEQLTRFEALNQKLGDAEQQFVALNTLYKQTKKETEEANGKLKEQNKEEEAELKRLQEENKKLKDEEVKLEVIVDNLKKEGIQAQDQNKTDKSLIDQLDAKVKALTLALDEIRKEKASLDELAKGTTSENLKAQIKELKETEERLKILEKSIEARLPKIEKIKQIRAVA